MQNAKRLAATAMVAGLFALLLYGLQSDSDERPLAEQPAAGQPPAEKVRSVVQPPAASREPGTVDASAPSVGGAQLGHALGFTTGSERQGIRIAELDALLDANDGEFREREQDMHTELKSILNGDPVTQSIEVRCADGFCRIKLDKPLDQGMPWHEIDRAIAPVTKGEMIFGAEPNGATRTTAYVYFSRDSQLPMASAARAPDDE